MIPTKEEKAIKEEYEGLLGATAEALTYNADVLMLEEAIAQITRPLRWGGEGWLDTLEQCMTPKTEADFVTMFKFDGLGGLLGFTDDAEGLRCESAAKKVGIVWEFKKFKQRFGLGTYNITRERVVSLSRKLQYPIPPWF